MACDACDAAINRAAVYFYRWKTASVVLMGCQQHIKEIIAALNATQDTIAGVSHE